ncbi:MAG TPA: hypothetical protein VFM96_13980 [Gaiellaceae bacterium]|nr:hypothetical protein [Gaiellaceae bacterium]
MYTVIRRYEGVTDVDEVVRRASSEFAALLAGQPGFQGYWVVNAGSGVVASISVFDRQEQAEASTRAAAGWVGENLAEFVPNAPQVTAGETSGTGA